MIISDFIFICQNIFLIGRDDRQKRGYRFLGNNKPGNFVGYGNYQ